MNQRTEYALPTQPYLPLANAYRVRVVKHSTADVSNSWSNTYAMHDASGNPPSTWSTFASSLANFEANVYYPEVQVDAVEIYSWSVGKAPGGPQPPLITFPFVLTGQVVARGDPAYQGGGYTGAEVVTFIEHQRTTGPRNGKSFYRASLQKTDITATGAAEPWIFSNAGPSGHTIPASILAQFVSYLDGYTTSGSPPDPNIQLGIVHTHRSGGVIVSAVFGQISGIQVKGITGLQRRKKHR